MRVTVRLFARLRDIAGAPELARDVACDGLVFTKPLDDRLDLRERLGVLPVFPRLALYVCRAQELHQLLVLLFGCR